MFRALQLKFIKYIKRLYLSAMSDEGDPFNGNFERVLKQDCDNDML